VHRVRSSATQQRVEARAPAHRVHDEVGAQQLAGGRAHALDVRQAVQRPRQQLPHLDTAANLDPRLGLGLGRGMFDHRTPAGDGLEPLVAGPRLAVLDRRRHRPQRIEPRRAGVEQRASDLGQLERKGRPAGRQQVVRLAELRDAVAVPPLPGIQRSAMMLARDGHEVTVLERDPAPVPDSPPDRRPRLRARGSPASSQR
jgi:hypothetical protein